MRPSKGIGRARHVARKSAVRSAFVLEVDERFEMLRAEGSAGGTNGAIRRDRCTCDEVPGFCEAAAAARDPGAPWPLRLGLIAPNQATREFLERWAEDTDCVRRTITIRRVLDGTRVTAVATIAAHGSGIATSLAVESVASNGERRMLRSGVHPKAVVCALESALAKEELT